MHASPLLTSPPKSPTPPPPKTPTPPPTPEPPPPPPTPLPEYISQFTGQEWFEFFFPSATSKVRNAEGHLSQWGHTHQCLSHTSYTSTTPHTHLTHTSHTPHIHLTHMYLTHASLTSHTLHSHTHSTHTMSCALCRPFQSHGPCPSLSPPCSRASQGRQITLSKPRLLRFAVTLMKSVGLISSNVSTMICVLRT